MSTVPRTGTAFSIWPRTGAGSGPDVVDEPLAQTYGDAVVPAPLTAAPLRTQMNVPLCPAVSDQCPLKQLPFSVVVPLSVDVYPLGGNCAAV